MRYHISYLRYDMILLRAIVVYLRQVWLLVSTHVKCYLRQGLVYSHYLPDIWNFPVQDQEQGEGADGGGKEARVD